LKNKNYGGKNAAFIYFNLYHKILVFKVVKTRI